MADRVKHRATVPHVLVFKNWSAPISTRNCHRAFSGIRPGGVQAGKGPIRTSSAILNRHGSLGVRFDHGTDSKPLLIVRPREVTTLSSPVSWSSSNIVVQQKMRTPQPMMIVRRFAHDPPGFDAPP
jgi:hypothetical protein